MQRFQCSCGNVLFFESSWCLGCCRPVAYDPTTAAFVVLDATTPGRLCSNGIRHGVCNWLAPATSNDPLCMACSMDQVIPNLGEFRNVALWAKMEAAKRRLVYELVQLGIPVARGDVGMFDGLTFRIVSTRLDSGITTGYLNGMITVNLEEADDTYRQIHRQNLGEVSRTLLGHFRHESGHYLWQRWFERLPWNHVHRHAFREIFGDERADYSTALYSHYAARSGPHAPENFISVYASSHPWEDWAETWSHYLQMRDGMQTFDALGLDLARVALPGVTFRPCDGTVPSSLSSTPQEDADFLKILSGWLQIATVLNELSASVGQPLLYPFVVTPGVARKLRLIHYFVQVQAVAKAWG